MPLISACNVLSNTLWDVQMAQEDSITASGCWWGSPTPAADRVWDYGDDFRLGMVAQDDPAAAWVGW
jgi:hypothetical protein